MMKKVFTILLSVIFILASCAKVEDLSVRNANTNGTEITFSTKASVATKAIVDSTVLVDNFGVYGYVVPGDYSVNGGYLMKNAEYDKDGNAVGGPYYWPVSDNNTGIDFIFTAYSQFESAPVWENDTLKLAVPALTQALIDNPDDFNDVLWAQTAYNHHQNSLSEHERVNLNFRHALSWIQFRGEVTNSNIKWAKVKQISFGEYRDSIAGVAPIAEIPAYDDTTDTWMNLRRSSNVDGSPTRTSTDGGATYVDNFEIPAALVAEIKSYYSINNGTAGDYDLHMGNSVWPSAEIRQLRVVKDVPAAYRMPVEMTSGDVIVFFDALKYLNDNGYKVTYRVSGGKPAIFDYPIIDLFVNGTAYTIVGFNFGVSTVYDANVGGSIPSIEYTIEHHDAVPGVPGVDPVPASGSEGLFVDGTLCIPTKDTITVNPSATYGTQKDTTLNYVSAQVDTIFTNAHEILGNALVIPQPVPQNVTIVFDICIVNPNGDEVVFTDRKITRTINTGKDMVNVDYTPSWAAANKYIYNFKFDGDKVEFLTSVLGWTDAATNQYHVWDYSE